MCARSKEAFSIDLNLRVLLCNMPFGVLLRPHPALGLLKAGLRRAGLACDVRYFCLDFVKQVGLKVYESLTTSKLAYMVQPGEWFFAPAVFGSSACDVDSFSRHAHEMVPEVYTPEHIQEICQEQDKVEPFLDGCVKEIEQGGYDLVGFTISSQQLNASLALAKRLKEVRPGILTIFGGYDMFPPNGIEVLRDFEWVDYTCLGEGDRVFPEFAKRLAAGKPVDDLPGLAMRQGSQVVATDPDQAMVLELDDLPFPDYDDYTAQFKAIIEADWHGVLNFEASRGCTRGESHKCIFCGAKYLTYRSKSPERTAHEIRYLVEHHLPVAMNAMDYHAPLPTSEWFARLGPLPGVPNIAFDLLSTVKKKDLIQMKRASVGAVCVGIESLSTSILRQIGKGITTLTNIQVMKWCRELRLVLYWNWLYGFPGEDIAEYERMARLVPSIVHLSPPIVVAPFYLLRFSPYCEHPERYGLVNIRPMPTSEDIFPGLPEEQRTNLATIFQFDYLDGRQPEVYAEGIKEAFRSWIDAAPASLLAYVDDGERLRLFDTRPVAKQGSYVLTGAERAVFLACECQQRLTDLCSLFPDMSPGAIQNSLKDWLELRWLISEDNTYLGLAVDVGQFIKPRQRASTPDDFCLALAKSLLCPRVSP